MESYIKELRKQAIGGVIKYIKLENLTDAMIELPNMEQQKYIVSLLVKIKNIIEVQKKEISQYDELVRARFVEMFGDPIANPMSWEETNIKNECYYIKDGPHKSLEDIGKENGGHPFISVRNIVNHTIDFSTAKYISDDDYTEAISKCHPEKGDILYSKGGTTGIAKLVDVDIEFANWVHVAVLKFDKNRLNGIFFENMLNSDYCYEQSQRLTKGIANKDLVLSAMAQIKMYLPPLELQNQFADFVAEVDKSKLILDFLLDGLLLIMQKTLEKHYTLQNYYK
jgi:type I restriction enzyme S subunit